MLPTLIQRFDKNHFISKTRDLLKFYRLSGAIFYDCINTIHQFIKNFLNNKMSVFEEYGAFKRDATEKLNIAKIKAGSNSVNTCYRVTSSCTLHCL